jgi:hypothetical protein
VTKHVRKAAALSIALLFMASAAEAASKRKGPKHPPLDVPIAGTLAGGGTFAGTLSLKEFVAREGQVFALGTVRGTATSALGAPLGTALVGTVALPVTVGAGLAARETAAAVVTQQQVCQVLNLEIGSISFDLLGVQVTTLPVGINLTADGSGANVLGHLICTILETVNNVLGLVDLLNALLGLLTGLF